MGLGGREVLEGGDVCNAELIHFAIQQKLYSIVQLVPNIVKQLYSKKKKNLKNVYHSD